MMDRIMTGIVLRGDTVLLAWNHGDSATLNGHSNVRSHQTRKATCPLDNFMGQLGNAALSLYQTGSLDQWMQSRNLANSQPRKGDGGEDLIGCNIDVKTSLMRGSRDPRRYRLPVREYHLSHVYYLALVENPEWYGTTFNQSLIANVTLVGWACSSMLPEYPNGDGDFSGARVLFHHELLDLPPLKWSGVEYFEPMRCLDAGIAQW